MKKESNPPPTFIKPPAPPSPPELLPLATTIMTTGDIPGILAEIKESGRKTGEIL